MEAGWYMALNGENITADIECSWIMDESFVQCDFTDGSDFLFRQVLVMTRI